MRVSYLKSKETAEAEEVPAFLREEISSTRHIRTGFDHDFPAIANDPALAALIGHKGRYFTEGRISIRKWWNERDRSTVGSVLFANTCEGPPGAVHGGAIATALDDILGSQVWRYAGYARRGMPTITLTIRYNKFVPMEKPLLLRASVTRILGRRVHVMGGLYDPLTGEPHAEAEGVFYIIRPEVEDDILPYEDALQRFGRLVSTQRQSEELRAYYAPAGRMSKL